jgi:hypothetical protein
MSPRWLYWPAAAPVVTARYSVSGELSAYLGSPPSTTQWNVINDTESGTDADWWSRYAFGEFRLISNTQLRWTIVRDPINNPYATVALFLAAFSLGTVSLSANGSPVAFSSSSWSAIGSNNLNIFFNGTGYTALFASLSNGDSVEMSVDYS